jgi:ADP-ribose pyrophosphatase
MRKNEMPKKFDQITSNLIKKNPYWEYVLDRYILPNGEEADYHYVRTEGSTMVIPRYGEEFILVRQYRYLNKRFSIEFPGGGIKPGNSAERNAREELLEESGFRADKLQKIGEFNPFNGVTSEICEVFLAEDLNFVGQETEASEEIEVIRLTSDSINEKIKEGEIWDGMTIASWCQYRSME